MPSSLSSSLLNWRETWSIMPEVEASVYSHTLPPVSRYDSRSGIKSMQSALCSEGSPERVCAYSWKMVLKFII